MARYYPISPLFWSDSMVRGLPTDNKLMALYLLTCEHRNLEGLYRLPTPYAAADLGWSDPYVFDVMKHLAGEGFLKYDPTAQVIFICKALKYHQPVSERQITGAINALQSVPDTILWPDFLAAAEEYAPALHARLDTHTHTHSNGYRNGSIPLGDTHA